MTARLLEGREREEMDRAMGIEAMRVRMPERRSDGTFVLHTVRPTDLRVHLEAESVRTGAARPFDDGASVAVRLMANGSRPLLQGAEREAMDRAMGVDRSMTPPPERLADGRFVLHTMKPSEVRKLFPR